MLNELTVPVKFPCRVELIASIINVESSPYTLPTCSPIKTPFSVPLKVAAVTFPLAFIFWKYPVPKRKLVVPIEPVFVVGGVKVDVNSVVPNCIFVPAVIVPVVA